LHWGVPQVRILADGFLCFRLPNNWRHLLGLSAIPARPTDSPGPIPSAATKPTAQHTAASCAPSAAATSAAVPDTTITTSTTGPDTTTTRAAAAPGTAAVRASSNAASALVSVSAASLAAAIAAAIYAVYAAAGRYSPGPCFSDAHTSAAHTAARYSPGPCFPVARPSTARTSAGAAAGAGTTALPAVAALAAELAYHLPRAAVYAGALSLYRFDRQAVVLECLLEQRCLFAERGRPLRGLLHRSGRGCG